MDAVEHLAGLSHQAGGSGAQAIASVVTGAAFALGLFLSEFARQRNAREAVTSSLHALKATGFGILAELALACLAGATWVIGVWVHFAGR